MNPLEQRLLAVLKPWRTAPAWRLALSGGLDSTVLLHMLVNLGKQVALPPLSVIHVHHGLQAAADAWPERCQRLCERLGVPLIVEHVQVASEASVERAARNARYAALQNHLGDGEVLLTAQHRDDQAETLLQRMARGTGVRGLAGMPGQRSLGRGLLVRPLLTVSREALLMYALEMGLEWVDDPSNADTRLSRNFVRHQVMPALHAHWPAASANIARAAEHLREAQELLDDLAAEDLAHAASDHGIDWLTLPALRLAPLQSLSPARQRNALRHWLAPRTLLPDTDHWAGWANLRDASGDATPLWRLAGGMLRRAGGHIWWLSGDWLQTPLAPEAWERSPAAAALPGNGYVTLQGEGPGGALQLRYRRGGETMIVPARGHRDLKRLLNERGVPFFLRDRLPLLYRENELLAVANLPGLEGSQHGDWHLHWMPPTNAQGLS